MAIRLKNFIPDRLYFVTFSIYKWQRIFTSEKYINLVFKWFDYMKLNYNNRIHGYVIMPHHIHFIIYVSEMSPSLSKLIQNGKRFLAYQIVSILKEESRNDILGIFSSGADFKKGARHKIFQDRYDSKDVSSTKLFLEKLNYIHNNPCNKGWMLASEPVKYKYSSASNYYFGKGVYDVELIN